MSTPPDPPNRTSRERHSPGERLIRLVRKELRETLRDRRTLTTLVLMPLLVYPLLGLVFQRFLVNYALNTDGTTNVPRWLVGVQSAEDFEVLNGYLAIGDVILRTDGDDQRRRELLRRLDRPGADYAFSGGESIDYVLLPEPARGVSHAEVDAAVLIRRNEPSEGLSVPIEVEVLYRAGVAGSLGAVRFLEERLQSVNLRYLIDHTRADEQLQLPARVTTRNVADQASGGVSLNALIPLVLILMTIVGGVYPAIDLTAGERERGTLEPLIAAPVPRFSLLFAKYVAVVTVSVLTGIVNLIGMAITLSATGLTRMLIGETASMWGLIVQVLGLLILFATFFSAVLLAITTFARSFKEAQAYLIPLMLLSLAPGIASLLPQMEYSPHHALVPLLNMVLLARDLLTGSVTGLTAVLAIISTLLYACAAIGFASRIFGTDAVLYGSRASWSELLRPATKSHAAAPVDLAMLTLAMLFPVFFLASSLIGRIDGMSIAWQLGASGAATLCLFGLVPIAIVHRWKLQKSTALAMRTAPWPYWIGGVALGLTLWPLALELVLATQPADFERRLAANPELWQQLADRIALWRDVPLPLLLVAFAVIPGICEEIFFRGFVLSAFHRAVDRWQAIAISAILFGAFHVVMSGNLAPERFLPSTALGFVLAWLTTTSGSLFPGMLLHACHNALMITAATHPERWGLKAIADKPHVPTMWLAIASTVVLGVFAVLTYHRGKGTHAAKVSPSWSDHEGK